MALVTIGTYTCPEPSVDGYHSIKKPVSSIQLNAKGVRIGEFVKWQYGVNMRYSRLLGADYHALIAAAQGTGATSLTGVSVTFYDDDSGTYLTKTMLLESEEKELFRISPEEYINVSIELLEQ